MGSVFQFLRVILLQAAGLFLALGSVFGVLWTFTRQFFASRLRIFFLSLFVFGLGLFYFSAQVLPNTLEYPLFMHTFGPGTPPSFQVAHLFEFFKKFDDFEKVDNIAHDPNDLPLPLSQAEEKEVEVNLETKEVIAEIAPGITMNYWTFNSQVPGPFVRVREGDTVHVNITNSATSIHPHNVDFHAVNGPGGGAGVTTVMPGERKEFSFKALNPGLYVYHCAVPNVATHMTRGMYGMILVEPKEGLSPVDKEFYIMQGEWYATGALGKQGLQVFDGQALMDGHPKYVFFNGKIKSLMDNMQVKAGEKVRLFVGNGGVNLISSFHVIGEVFDTVYPEGGIGGSLNHNVQTTLIPAGGASIVEFVADVPGEYILVDHALSRLDRGAWGMLKVLGDERPEIFKGTKSNTRASGH